MAHPDFQHAMAFGRGEILDALQQRGMTVGADLGITELAYLARLELAAELQRHGVHAVADAEHRYTQLECEVGRTARVGIGNRLVTAGEDDPARREVAHEPVAHIPGMHFAIHAGLAQPARDELSDLGTEIENQDFVVHAMRWFEGNAGGRPDSFSKAATSSLDTLIPPGSWAPLSRSARRAHGSRAR